MQCAILLLYFNSRQTSDNDVVYFSEVELFFRIRMSPNHKQASIF